MNFLHRFTAKGLILRIGDYDKSNTREEPIPHIEKEISTIHQHEKFDPFTYEYDIALLHLSSAVEFTQHISPICLPSSDSGEDDGVEGSKGYITGWGTIYEGKYNVAPILK